MVTLHLITVNRTLLTQTGQTCMYSYARQNLGRLNWRAPPEPPTPQQTHTSVLLQCNTLECLNCLQKPCTQHNG